MKASATEYIAEIIIELSEDHIVPTIGVVGSGDGEIYRVLYVKGGKEYMIIILNIGDNLTRTIIVDKVVLSQEVRLEDDSWMDSVEYNTKYGGIFND